MDKQELTFETHLPMFILDVLRHDVIEQVANIVKMLNDDGCIGWRDCWPHDFSPEDVVPALRELVREGFIEPLREDESGNQVIPVPSAELNWERDHDVLWFSLTEKGRNRWSNWEPPKVYP